MIMRLPQQQGFTLIEVIVAITILVTMSALAAATITVAMRSDEVAQDNQEAMRRLDRTWVTLENDFRHALGYELSSYDQSRLPAMLADDAEDYKITFLRGGNSNRLYAFRSELMRVAYKFDEEGLIRYSWSDPANPDEDLAQQRLLLRDIEGIEFEFLPASASDIEDSAWVDTWPDGQSSSASSGLSGASASFRDTSGNQQATAAKPPQAGALPLAVKVRLQFTEEYEMERLFVLAPGL